MFDCCRRQTNDFRFWKRKYRRFSGRHDHRLGRKFMGRLLRRRVSWVAFWGFLLHNLGTNNEIFYKFCQLRFEYRPPEWNYFEENWAARPRGDIGGIWRSKFGRFVRDHVLRYRVWGAENIAPPQRLVIQNQWLRGSWSAWGVYKFMNLFAKVCIYS